LVVAALWRSVPRMSFFGVMLAMDESLRRLIERDAIEPHAAH
jgi:hypothetical protein